MNKPYVFIGSSVEGLEIAQALQQKLQFKATAAVWDELFPLGEGTLEALDKQADEFDFAVLVFTADDITQSRNLEAKSVRDNVLFELGLFMGRLGRDRTYVVRTNQPDLKVPSDLLGITSAVYAHDVQNRLTAVGPAASAIIERIDALPLRQAGVEEGLIGTSVKLMIEQANRAQGEQEFGRNILLQKVVQKSLQQTTDRLKRVPDGFHVSASQYPEYLTSLQQDHDTQVRAIALVDQEERFWQLEAGLKILRTSNPKNQRVFVFSKAEELNRNIFTLLEHDQKYIVRLMSADNLKEFQPYNKDFCVIQAGESKLVAAYDGKHLSRTITFSSNQQDIAQHEKYFGEIYRAALPISQIMSTAGFEAFSNDPNERAEQLAKFQVTADRLIFGQSVRPLASRLIEMSDYISVDDYDAYEEDHAYFRDMMERMLSIFRRHRGAATTPCRVLEFGAGTGIFTKRLAREPNVDVTAMEIDWACYQKLRSNLRKDKLKNVVAINSDSRKYDPDGAGGRFQYIFSSFADHHIRDDGSKLRYLANARRNLEQGGLFIVGDEFLAEHDRSNSEERANALKAYHQHIIEIARKAGHENLARLEEEALDSGLTERGDFKLSRKQYEKFYQEAGFVLVTLPDKIGPCDRDDIGGVYVYTWQALT